MQRINPRISVIFAGCRFISQLSQLQLVKMLTLIKDNLNGLSLDDSLAKSKKLDTIDPNEDLNKVTVSLFRLIYPGKV